MSPQVKLEAIRRAVEAKTIPCPCVEGPACSPTCSCHNPLMSGGCKVCGPYNYREGKLLPGHTAHRIPDPVYAPLLAVVRVIQGMGWRLYPDYVTRNWEGLPPGSLAGALMWVCGETRVDFPLSILGADNPDEAALDAVLKALKEITDEVP